MQSLRARAAIISNIRHFFETRDVLEVDTPSLSQYSVTDPYLQPIHTQNKPKRYLQTSPEFAMKRLLAAGSGDIYQICKAFREDEVGRQHNPEFTLLEWYRVGFSMQMLIDEVKALLAMVLPVQTCDQRTYPSLFVEYCNLEPVLSSIEEVEHCCIQNELDDYAKSIKDSLLHDELSKNTNNKTIRELSDDKRQVLLQNIYRDSLLNVLFNQVIEPHIGQSIPIVVTHFPKSQAALATIDDNSDYANRFEVYFKSIELANGFNELTCATTQAQRFKQDNLKRNILKLPEVEIDTNFLSALNNGLPACSGVALGIDRLIMLALNKESISEVISFNYDNC